MIFNVKVLLTLNYDNIITNKNLKTLQKNLKVNTKTYKMKNKYFLGLIGLTVSSLISSSSFGQETSTPISHDSLVKSVNAVKHDVDNLKKLKVSGWVQAQYQIGEAKGISTFDGGNFLPGQYNRFMIRRGRVKFTYTQKLSQYVLQVNATERGVNLVEIFGKVTDPWTKSLTLTAGMMNRPFGFEIQQSSSDRETPERSRYIQVLLPNERDLGGMLTFMPIKGSKLFGLKIDGGMYSGNGLAVPGTTSVGVAGLVDTDVYKDFIGRLSYKKSFNHDKFTFGIGGSHYNGGIAYQNNKTYNTMTADANGLQKWVMTDTVGGATSFTGKKAPRIYYAGEFQVSFKSFFGTTTFRGEYITGTQSGSLTENKSVNVSTVNASNTVSRQFNGGNIYFVQRIGKTKHEFAVKYDWYDANTQVSAKDFAVGTSLKSADLKYQTLGLSYIHYYDENVKFMVYYNFVQNEKGDGLAGYTKDLKDNVFTVRMQYRF